ncbi:GAF domain-containing protein, partial [Candidatus Saccharibacteria bacterium]|nr:GAF domain-containing protein [Candidatus Saccharibacteria bacterium]
MAYGLLISFFWALVFSVILPLFVTTWVTAKVGPVGTIFFVGATAYAIVRHKLFDVRLVVARSIAYVLSVLVLGVVYGFIAFNLAALVSIDQDKIPLGQEVFYIALAVAMAFTFPPIRKFFNRVTNKMFYRDAYEPQVLIDELNKVLVGNIDLVDLLTKSSTIIGSTLKAEFCVFGIRETQNEGKRIIGTRTRSFSEEDINTVRKLTPKTGMKVIITDELGSDQRELHTLLLDNNIALMARLVDSAKKGNEGLGYLVLGSKKSGNPYSSQDVKILEIIADEMVIAIQNALHFEEIQNFAKTLQDKV